MTSFGIELNQVQIDFIKKRFNLESNTQVRNFIEKWVLIHLNHMIDKCR